jgi:hypothetical protein
MNKRSRTGRGSTERRASVLRLACFDLFVGAVVVWFAARVSDEKSPLRYGQATSTADLVGLVMQVGAGMAALVLAPMAVLASIRTGTRVVKVNQMRGRAFARASLWSVCVSVAAAGLAFLALATGGDAPQRGLTLACLSVMVSAFVSVVRVAREFAIYLRAKANDDVDDLAAPYIKVS